MFFGFPQRILLEIVNDFIASVWTVAEGKAKVGEVICRKNIMIKFEFKKKHPRGVLSPLKFYR